MVLGGARATRGLGAVRGRGACAGAELIGRNWGSGALGLRRWLGLSEHGIFVSQRTVFGVVVGVGQVRDTLFSRLGDGLVRELAD